MKLKILASMIVISLLAMGFSSVSAINIEDEMKLLEEYNLNLDDQDKFQYLFSTKGPKNRLITKVELIDGNPAQINRLNRYLNKLLFRPKLPIMLVNNLTFKVTYKVAVKNISKLSYASWFAPLTAMSSIIEGLHAPDLSNDTLIDNAPHTIIVENFTGLFKFSRAKLYRPLFKFLLPARFSFFGACKQILLPDLQTPTMSLTVDPVVNTSQVYVASVSDANLSWHDVDIEVTNITGGMEHSSFGALPSGNVSGGDMIEITDLHSGSEYNITFKYRYTDGIMGTVSWTQPYYI